MANYIRQIINKLRIKLRQKIFNKITNLKGIKVLIPNYKEIN